MRRISTMLIGAVILAAHTATAQPFQGNGFLRDGFDITGYTDLSYFDDGTDSGTFGRADLDMEFTTDPNANDVVLGFSLGFDGAKEFTGGTMSLGAFYPALIVGFGNNKVSVGAPRSVINRGYIPETIFANNTRLDLSISAFTGSILSFGTLINDFHPYGLRYDGVFGQTKVGFSAHRVDNSGVKADFYALAMSHTYTMNGPLPEVTFYGGVESINPVGPSKINYTLGVEARSDELRLGMLLGNRDSPTNTNTVELYGKYQFNNSFSTIASVLRFTGAGIDRTIYGIGAEYTFLNNAYISASIADGNNSIDTSYAVSIGWRF